MADISKITLPDGSQYNIKDSNAATKEYVDSKIYEEKDSLIVEMIQCNDTGNIVDGTWNVAKSGYTALGIMGINEQSSTYVNWWKYFILNNILYYGWSTVNSSTISNHLFRVYVLYKKN